MRSRPAAVADGVDLGQKLGADSERPDDLAVGAAQAGGGEWLSDDVHDGGPPWGSRHRLRRRAFAAPRAAVKAGAKRSRQAALTGEGRGAWQPVEGSEPVVPPWSHPYSVGHPCATVPPRARSSPT
jgi:hypothetical protein